MCATSNDEEERKKKFVTHKIERMFAQWHYGTLKHFSQRNGQKCVYGKMLLGPLLRAGYCSDRDDMLPHKISV